MKVFPLEIISPEGVKYQGDSIGMTVNTKSGYINLLHEEMK